MADHSQRYVGGISVFLCMRYGGFLIIFFSVFINLYSYGQMLVRVESSIYSSPSYNTVPEKHKNPDLKIYAGLAGLTIASYLLIDPDMQHETQENLTDWQRFSAYVITPMGSGTNTWYAIGATTVTAIALRNQRLKKTVLVWAGGLAINDVLTNQLKITFQRHRPSTGDAFNTFDWRNGSRVNKSFPSAHTSNIFTTATSFAIVYDDKKWVPAVAYSMATLVGISRIYRNAHWASDVVGGALVGFFSAKCSAFLIRKLDVTEGKKHRYLFTGF
jgi:membrane-associated phospholipid phosphatase